MFKPFAAANAVPVAARQIKLVPPAGNEAIVLQVAPGDTLDLSALADRKITMVRLDHRLVLLFEDKGHIVIEGVLTPDGHPVDGILTSPVEGKVLPLADLLASMGPLHTAEIMTQAGIEAPPALHSALAAIPPAIDYDPGRRPGLDLLGNEEFGSSLPLPEKKIGALDGDVDVDSPLVIDLDTRDNTTNNYYGYFVSEAAASDAQRSPWSGVEIVQVSSADGVAHVAIFDPDGGPMPIRLVIELGDTRMGDPGLLQVDPAVLAQFGASVTGDGTGRIVLETGKPLSADEMTTLLAAIRYYNTEDTFLMDNADREITVTAIHEDGQTSSATAYVPVLAYVEDSTNIDFFVGTRFSDIIVGLDGDNVIDAGRGQDRISTGSGNDRIDGGNGSDEIEAGGGNDQVIGGNGGDWIYGEDGDDRLDGGNGDDWVFAGNGNDTALGGAGSDYVDGGAGDDLLSGGEGVDGLFGGDGHDVLQGEDGDDWLLGEAGTDVLLGGTGNDLLIGGTEDDRLEGGDGDDVIWSTLTDGYDSLIDGGAGNDTLAITSEDDWTLFSVTLDGEEIRAITLSSANGFADFIQFDAQGNRNVRNVEAFSLEQHGSTNAILDFSMTQTPVSVDLDVDFVAMSVVGEATGSISLVGFKDVIGGAGNDRIVGDMQDNELFGGIGNDHLQGELGMDWLVGSLGDDVLDGGLDNDTLEGGRGNDRILAGDGNDEIEGGRGDDWIDAGDGSDFIRHNITDGFDSHVDGGTGFDWMLVESNSPGTRFAITLDGGTLRSLSLISPNMSQDIILTDAQGNSNVTGIEAFELVHWFPMNGTLDFSTTLTNIHVNFDLPSQGGGSRQFATGFSEISGFQHAIGGAGNDALFGDVNRNQFEGGAGNDILYTGDGDDALLGGAGDDVIRGGAGDDHVDAGDGDDLILHVIGDGFDTGIAGGAGNDVMRIESDLNATRFAIALDANGAVTGLSLHANGVTEQVIATDAQGNRNVTGVENIALHHEGSTDGTLDFSGATIAINVDLDGPSLVNGVGTGTATGFSEVRGFLNVVGGSGNDSLFGDGRDNRLEGGAGDDYMIGYTGNDVLLGGDGNDRLFGQEGDDQIFGGAGYDVLSGFMGNDVLDGGDGDDRLVVQFGHNTLTGGAGADQFRFTISAIQLDPVANGNHIVTDFNAAENDRICFYTTSFPESLGIGGALSGTLDPNRFVSGTDFTTSDQRFLFNTQDNTLYYDADGSGAAADRMAVCRLLQGSLDSSLIQLVAP
jgi:Ca2+-binding RTX toxin-like protein